jgi:hypothetical protein
MPGPIDVERNRDAWVDADADGRPAPLPEKMRQALSTPS